MTATDIVSRAPISHVYTLLGGPKLSRNRGRAFWRDGDGLSVAFNDEKGTFYDHAAGAGGGVLDLASTVLRCSRVEALRWLADATGVVLNDAPPDPAVVAERTAVKRDVPQARLWRRAALDLFDALLVDLKSALFDPTATRPEPAEIFNVEQLRSFIANAGEAALVAEFREWRDKWPHFTQEMIQSAARRERADRRALQRFLMSSSPEKRAAA